MAASIIRSRAAAGLRGSGLRATLGTATAKVAAGGHGDGAGRAAAGPWGGSVAALWRLCGGAARPRVPSDSEARALLVLHRVFPPSRLVFIPSPGLCFPQVFG